MKKYILPAIEIIDAEMEQQLMAGSLLLDIDDTETIDAANADTREFIDLEDFE